jgi:hypothetical protein
MYSTYEKRAEMVALAVWENCTKNGLGLDDDMQIDTMRSAYDAVHEAYRPRMHDGEWYDAALSILKEES